MWCQDADGAGVDAAVEALGRGYLDEDHLCRCGLLRHHGLLQMSLCRRGDALCLLRWRPALLTVAAQVWPHGHLRPAGYSNAPQALHLQRHVAVLRGHLQRVQLLIAGPLWNQCGGDQAPSSSRALSAMQGHLGCCQSICC